MEDRGDVERQSINAALRPGSQLPQLLTTNWPLTICWNICPAQAKQARLNSLDSPFVKTSRNRPFPVILIDSAICSICAAITGSSSSTSSNAHSTSLASCVRPFFCSHLGLSGMVDTVAMTISAQNADRARGKRHETEPVVKLMPRFSQADMARPELMKTLSNRTAAPR